MKVTKTYKPGDDGSKRYHDKYGEQLCAVRYRRSPCSKTIYTTVEIIVAERDAYPRKPAPHCVTAPASNQQKWVAVKIAFDELELRNEIKRIGGRWSKCAQAWVASRNMVERSNLSHRIVEGLIDKCLDVPI
ncbi:hypothetical protein ACNKU7_16890 [Microbulbifer sp. SA54]|uniref:hypothetical protein n=1 Tax=Microbulbifer sp. SA54 TaxID=3401577 RepID=UPI003AAC9EB2